jgi:ubiquinone biosynthesis protein
VNSFERREVAKRGTVENQIKLGNEPLQQQLDPFLREYQTPVEKIGAVQAALESEGGKYWREELGKWTVRMVPVELLVPEVHRGWRPLVREAMLFVVSKLSASRLAPKIVEQMGLAPDTPPEVRLLRFIAKVPGLQKIGQMLARNRNLDPRLRRALIKLENGISDVSIEEVHAIIRRELESKIKTYDVRLDAKMLSEASVSAVVGFTWRNPKSRRRERGVFKVLKPHIPSCYAEDMNILRQLARHLVHKHRTVGMQLGGVAETLAEIQILLTHEVDFLREQATLLNALTAYRSVPGVRVPRLLPQLSTATITALTREKGRKVTEAMIRPSKLRERVAERLAEVLLAVPVLAAEKNAIFHADPHAGNILYDKRSNELVILDWALTERLTLEQRKSVFLLVVMLILRDSSGVSSAIEQLCLRGAKNRWARRVIREHVAGLLDRLPLTKWPGAMDAMRLLDKIAMEGVHFPTALLMFRKASFTLEGVLEDIAGSSERIDSVVAGYALAHCGDSVARLFSMLSLRDLMALDWSALTLTSRLVIQTLARQWQSLSGLSPHTSAA